MSNTISKPVATISAIMFCPIILVIIAVWITSGTSHWFFASGLFVVILSLFFTAILQLRHIHNR